MIAKYVQQGETMDYVATAALDYGDVVNLGSRIGIAGNAAPAGATCAVHICGVFELPLAADEAADVPVGAALYWDAAKQAITATAPAAVTDPKNAETQAASETETAGKVPAGYAFTPAVKNAGRVLVKLLG